MMGPGGGGAAGSGLADLSALVALAQDPKRYAAALEELGGREAAIARRATELDERDIAQRELLGALDAREAALALREAAVTDREAALEAAVAAVAEQHAAIAEVQGKLPAYIDRLQALRAEVGRRAA